MTNIVRFPTAGHSQISASQIPREEFERLASLALDVVDQIMVLIDRSEEHSKILQAGSVAVSEPLQGPDQGCDHGW